MEYIKSVFKKKEKLTYLSDEKMQEVNNAIDISLGLHNIRNHRT